MIHIPLICKVNRILATLTFLVICVTMQAQYGTYERFAEVLVNTSYNSVDQPIYLPSHSNYSSIVTQGPKNGYVAVGMSQGSAALELFVDYTPDAGFIGLDTAVVEITIGGPPIPLANIYYAQFVFNVVPSIVSTTEDYYTVIKNSANNYFDVVANDNSTAPNLLVGQIAAVMGGNVNVTGDSLLYTPNLNFKGMAYLTYTACDSVGSCKSEVVNICVVDTTNPVPTDTIYLMTALTDDLSAFLPSSNFFATLDPVHGALEFIPNSDAFIYHPGLTAGLDEFEVSDGASIRYYVIDVIPDYVNSFVFDDFAAVQPGHKVEINVKENDRTGNFSVGSYTNPSHGELIKISNGVFKYIADTSFTGVVTFEYEVCALQNCETGTVEITVSDFAPDHAIAIHELTGLMNRDLLINYDVPVDLYDFSITSLATNGLAVVHSGLDTITEGCVVSIGRFMITYTPDSGFEGFDEFTLTYCSASGQCKDVVISVHILDIPVYDTCHCQDQCVWPGDVNFDGEVDMTDLLSLGRDIGDIGYERPNPSPNLWYGQYGDDWNRELRGKSLADEKHCDTDGDGYIRLSDTAAISTFYGNHHTLIPKQEFTVKPYVIGLEHDLDTTPSIGDTITLYLTIGNQANPAANLSGVSMSVSFDPNSVDSAYTKITPVTENWITREGFPLFMSKDDDINFDLGLSRIDKEGHHGYGRVFALDIIIDDDLDGLRPDKSFPVKIFAHNIVGLDAEGREFIIPEQRLSFNVRVNDDKGSNEVDKFNVFPNPVGDQLTIDYDLSKATSLIVTDVHGRQIAQFNEDIPLKISTINYAPGMYVIRLVDEGEIKTTKFLKVR